MKYHDVKETNMLLGVIAVEKCKKGIVASPSGWRKAQAHIKETDTVDWNELARIFASLQAEPYRIYGSFGVGKTSKGE